MNTQTSATLATDETMDLYDQQCFRDIDNNTDHSQRFQIAMLKLGRILTKHDSPIFCLSTPKIARALDRHRDKKIGSYSSLDIRNHFWQHMEGEIVGGGIRVEYSEDDKPHRRNEAPHFYATFSRIYPPQSMQIKAPNTPALKDNSQIINPA